MSITFQSVLSIDSLVDKKMSTKEISKGIFFKRHTENGKWMQLLFIRKFRRKVTIFFFLGWKVTFPAEYYLQRKKHTTDTVVLM